jgi:hypothetical protein
VKEVIMKRSSELARTRTVGLLATIVLVTAPAFAEIDLAGNWAPRLHEDWQDHSPGPDAVDYLGLPINEEARAKALSYTASVLSLPERQCLYYPPQYVVIGPQGFKIWAEADPVTGRTLAWKIGAAIDRDVVTIWMDGRPHPSPNAPHYFSGFTTGVWEGDMLTAYTTHVKAGYLRRNGVPSSDEATVTLHIVRHADILTIFAIIEDPIYLTEPYFISRNWQLDPKTQIPPTPAPCMPEAEVARLNGQGAVPHILPGRNPFVDEVTKMYHIPVEAVMGGAETMYPEYRRKLRDEYVAPEKCVRYCCGWGGGAANTLKGCTGVGFATTEQPDPPVSSGTSLGR